MRNQKIATAGLAAGSEHSVALTLDGGVFTWGSGRYGQLGHGGNHSENLPKKIVELMGTKVTQVAIPKSLPVSCPIFYEIGNYFTIRLQFLSGNHLYSYTFTHLLTLPIVTLRLSRHRNLIYATHL